MKSFPMRDGPWGIRQIDHLGEPTGGGTYGCGWYSKEEAEAANPPTATFTYEAFERWPDDGDDQ